MEKPKIPYQKKEQVCLKRDILGIKPIFYALNPQFAFASEKKALEKQGFININELNARKILIYNTKTKKIKFIQREFFKITPLIKDSLPIIEKKVKELLEKAITKKLPKEKFGICFIRTNVISNTFL